MGRAAGTDDGGRVTGDECGVADVAEGGAR